MDHLRQLVAFLVVLGVLIFVHEMGHYLAARWRGVHVEAFSLGFGQSIARWTDKSGTVWKLAWLPLGGYVKLHGQERPEDVSPEARAALQPGRTYQGKSVLSRAIIIAAGPVANFLLAAVLFIALIGFAGQPVSMPVVSEVIADGAAARAGLLAGDRVEAIDGAAVTRFDDIQRIVSASPDRLLSVRILRAGQEQTLAVTPDGREAGGHRIGVLGIRSGVTEYVHVSPWQTISAGLAQTWEVTAQTAAGVAGLFTGAHGLSELGGPLRIAQISGQAAQLGIASLVGLIAVLSVNLGLMNLIPIPVLDGGHLLFLAAEAVRGRPVPPKAQDYSTRAGLALLACLFLVVTWNDLPHLGLVRWVSSLIG